jgi:ABC-type glycerol-3-phosphate transport system permease component
LTGVYNYAARASLMPKEIGPVSIPAADNLETFRIGAQSIGPSLTRSWHVSAVAYYPFILLSPLLALAFVYFSRPGDRPLAVFLFVGSSALVATGPFISNSAIYRYLHPIAWVNVLIIAALVVSAARSTFRRASTL